MSWLTEPGSLTARCQAASSSFAVRLLAQGVGRPLPDEAALLDQRTGRLAWTREVLLVCDGVPVIYAHTVLPRQPRGALTGWLAGLGNRSLGSLLFAHPGFSRSPLQYRRLDGRSLLFRRAAQSTSFGGACLWARRSSHSLGNQTVLVTEVFFPAVSRLES